MDGYKDNEVKPSKLLTKTYEDDYGIYENRVFCDLVDDVLAFARKEIRFLREMIYTNRTIEINLLERVNHLNYFLALGKLHTGYSRNFDSYYDIAARCLNKLQFISNSIIPRLKRPVYKNNRLRPARAENCVKQIFCRCTEIIIKYTNLPSISKPTFPF